VLDSQSAKLEKLSSEISVSGCKKETKVLNQTKEKINECVEIYRQNAQRGRE